MVLETLDGRSDDIRGFTVATRVFGRGEDFDQALNPIVSIQASKLRRALERYYLVAGQADPVRIDIPKGTYVPVFTRPVICQDVDGILASHTQRIERTWPTIIVRPFLNLTGDNTLDWLGPGFASELRMEMTRHQDIKVVTTLVSNA